MTSFSSRTLPIKFQTLICALALPWGKYLQKRALRFLRSPRGAGNTRALSCGGTVSREAGNTGTSRKCRVTACTKKSSTNTGNWELPWDPLSELVTFMRDIIDLHRYHLSVCSADTFPSRTGALQHVFCKSQLHFVPVVQYIKIARPSAAAPPREPDCYALNGLFTPACAESP